MKITFFNHSFIEGSGIDYLIGQYSRRLARRGHEVKILTFSSNSEPPEGVSVIREKFLGSTTRYGSGVLAPILWNSKNIKEALEDSEIVVTMNYPCSLIKPPKSCKWVHIEWSTPPNYGFYSSLSRTVNSRACKKADLTIVPSYFVLKYVRQVLKGTEPRLLYINGIDFDSRIPNPSIATRKGMVLFVGRLAPHKNLELLIRSFRAVVEVIPHASLYLVGDFPFEKYRQELYYLTDSIGLSENVRFTGVVSEESLSMLYNECEVYCSPTTWEGFMRCDAYAYAKPMVGFEAGPNSETLNHGGLIAPRITSENLASAILYYLNNPEFAFNDGRRGYEWARDTLDLNLIVSKLEKEFRCLLES